MGEDIVWTPDRKDRALQVMLRDGLTTHLNTRVTLPTHLVENNGMPMLKELPNVRSTVRKYVSDADITSTYPNGEIIMNLSKETTMMELGRIKGVTTSAQRLVGVNLTGGPVNAIEILEEVMKAPNPWDLLEEFKDENK